MRVGKTNTIQLYTKDAKKRKVIKVHNVKKNLRLRLAKGRNYEGVGIGRSSDPAAPAR